MNTNDYTYILPQEKIAIYPLPHRDTSKLLVYKNKQVLHSGFLSLPEYLPENSLLFLNNTKVIPARLHFRKDTGADIEIFLLHPLLPSPLLSVTMTATNGCTWECAIGNLKRWSPEMSLQLQVSGVTLTASLTDRNKGVVEFTWNTGASFAQIIHEAGETPLPPYIKRKSVALDIERYQTIYSHFDGAVAAPTAGLHFTTEVFKRLKAKGIKHDFLTLHVSAGTFQPIKTKNADEHIMHEEQVIITRANLEHVLRPGTLITAVGTTSMRTLESLYWFGAKLLKDPESVFNISQHDVFTMTDHPSAEEAIMAVARYMDKKQMTELAGETSIFIKPGYDFKICKALITNFHQPGSTLLLLVAAFIGEDWRKIYDEALKNDYRFLSYGDSSLLMRE